MNIRLARSERPTPDFEHLVAELNRYLAITDGNEHEFYNQFNGLAGIDHFVVAYLEDLPVGCGAFRIYDENTVEVKRMFTDEENRGKGIARFIINELESWAAEEGFTRLILETGKRQKEAVLFYEQCGYELIPKYDQYQEMENSLCFGKTLG